MSEKKHKQSKQEQKAEQEQKFETTEQGAETPASDESAPAAVSSEELAKAIAQGEQYLDMARRIQAEFDNYRRRNQNVYQDAFADGKKEILSRVLPILDNLQRALDTAEQSDPFVQGVVMVGRQFADVLKAVGVEEIEAKDQDFDPNFHNAVMEQEAEDGQAGKVLEVLQKGYTMNGKVLRHSMVKVGR